MPPVSTPAGTSPGFRRDALLISAIVLLFLIGSGIANAIRKDVTQGFDELAHVSYLAEIQRTGRFSPPVDRMRMLSPATFRVTGVPNYLNHPAVYYAALTAIGLPLDGRPQAVLVYRFVNVGLVALGLAALLALGYGAAPSKLDFYAFAIPLATIPTLIALAGAVNNDNLAIAGGALALLGAERWLAGRGRAWFAAMLVGLILAGWAKFTALLLVGGSVGLVALYCVWRGRAGLAAGAAVALALVVAAAPYGWFVLQYGSPVPEVPGHVLMMEQGAREMGWADRRLSLPDYLVNFATLFVTQFMPSLAPRSTLNLAMLSVPVAIMGLSVAGLACAAVRLRRRQETPTDLLALAGWVSIGGVLLAHIRFGYLNHLATGWLLDGYPRYYLPAAGIAMLACLSLLASLSEGLGRRIVVGFLIAGPIAFSLLGAPIGA